MDRNGDDYRNDDVDDDDDEGEDLASDDIKSALDKISWLPSVKLGRQPYSSDTFGRTNSRREDSNGDGVRGLTCIPAVTSGLENKIGSIEPGLDADLLIVTGDPVDPRTSVEAVYQNGRRIYDTQTSRRRW